MAPVVDPQSGAVGEDAQVRIGHQDPLAEIVPQTVHHAEHDDQGGTPTATPPVEITVLSDAVRTSAGSAGSAGRSATRAWREAEARPRPRSRYRGHLSLRPHGGKEDHVADGRLVGEDHHQAVDAQAHTAGGRHAVLQGPDVVGVEGVGLLVAGGALAHLVLEAAPLIVGIVELAERVRQLLAADEQLEPLGEGGIAAVLLGQRRERLGVVEHEGRLHQLGLEEDLEDLVLQAAAGRAARPLRPARRDGAAPARISSSVAVRRSRPARSRIPSMNGTRAKRRREVERRAVALDPPGAETVLDHAADQTLDQAPSCRRSRRRPDRPRAW